MSERRLRAFHARRAGATSRAFAKTDSYARLEVALYDALARAGERGGGARGAGTRVLDLACGDHALANAIGVDLSIEELTCSSRDVRGASPDVASVHDAAKASRAVASVYDAAEAALDVASAHDAAGASPDVASVHDAAGAAPAVANAHGAAGATLDVANAVPRAACVQARAQALPFRDASFDACVCHLAFMLFDDIEQVVGELARVLVPGGVFVALLGGGPVEPPDSSDAFHRFLVIGAPHFVPVRFGDPRAKSERGWRELFAGWSEPRFERVELELGGTFDSAWEFLGASYQLDPAKADLVRDQLRSELGERVSCKVACWIATVTH